MSDAVWLGFFGLVGSIIVSLFAYLTARLARVVKEAKNAVVEAKVAVVETKVAVAETKTAIAETKEKVADIALDAKKDIVEQNKSLAHIEKHTNGTLSAMTDLAKQSALDNEILRRQVERLLLVQEGNGKEVQPDA